jgi:hypothetical protein
MYIGLHVKYPLFLSDFNKNLKYLERFSKNTDTYNFMKIRPSGSRVLPCGRTDGQTDMMKLIVACRNFAKVPKKSIQIDAILLRVKQKANINKSNKRNSSVILY